MSDNAHRAPCTVPPIVLRLRSNPSRDEALAGANEIMRLRSELERIVEAAERGTAPARWYADNARSALTENPSFQGGGTL